ncbi:hypothetical protein GCM10011374_30260 [Kocuria dechangensis]|uniref:Uncharacterized protein n=1 Tax=Kocuria dechangensis TaxID=1176249 RepID=A0A917H2B5_9MICC|nr:hypothetical protein [Kocuria dechangensis]GGG64558.1 hypothetical protein GCM10011374_30260 [Kocuria dechangensis]
MSPTGGRTALRVAACAALGLIGAGAATGCLVALFLANLSFFGERPQVPAGYTLLMLSGVVTGIGIPALVTARLLRTGRQRALVAVAMLAGLLLISLPVMAILGS